MQLFLFFAIDNVAKEGTVGYYYAVSGKIYYKDKVSSCLSKSQTLEREPVALKEKSLIDGRCYERTNETRTYN